MNLVPNIPANAYTLSAVVIGFLLIDDATPAEQSSLGNWLALVAQILRTNATQQQVLNNRNNQSTEFNSHIVNDNNLDNNNSNITESEQIQRLEKIVAAIQKEINNLKNGINN